MPQRWHSTEQKRQLSYPVYVVTVQRGEGRSHTIPRQGRCTAGQGPEGHRAWPAASAGAGRPPPDPALRGALAWETPSLHCQKPPSRHPGPGTQGPLQPTLPPPAVPAPGTYFNTTWPPVLELITQALPVTTARPRLPPGVPPRPRHSHRPKPVQTSGETKRAPRAPPSPVRLS